MQDEKRQLKHKMQQTFSSIQDQNTYLWGAVVSKSKYKTKGRSPFA